MLFAQQWHVCLFEHEHHGAVTYVYCAERTAYMHDPNQGNVLYCEQ